MRPLVDGPRSFFVDSIAALYRMQPSPSLPLATIPKHTSATSWTSPPSNSHPPSPYCCNRPIAMSPSPLLYLPAAPSSAIQTPSRAWTACSSPLHGVESLCSLTRGTFESLDIEGRMPLHFHMLRTESLISKTRPQANDTRFDPSTIPCGSH